MNTKTNYDTEIPKEAIEYLKGKGYTASYYWHDTWKETHARAFTVAKMLKLELLQDVHNALNEALESGQTYNEFAKNIIPILKNSGWWGKPKIANPYNGKDEEVQLGSPRRLKTIFYTNIGTAYQAGHYKAMTETTDMLPYWQYLAVMDNKTRKSHKLLHGKVFLADDPIWDTIYPPNGWGCRCMVRALSAEQVKAMGLKVTNGSKLITKIDSVIESTGEIVEQSVYTDPSTGRKMLIDKGWDYNVGESWVQPFVPKPYNGGYYEHKTVGLDAKMQPISNIKGTSIDQNRLLPGGKDSTFYVKAFLNEFNAKVGNPIVFKDVVGDAVIISERLFTINKNRGYTLDNIKVNKNERGRFMLILADAIKTPDEVWLTPEVRGGKTIYNKQYIKFFDDNDHAAGYILFELLNGAWQGRTVFPYKSSEKHKIDNTREYGNGSLIYKK